MRKLSFQINGRYVVIALYALLFAMALLGSIYTYLSTPDVDNFLGFAEPRSTKEYGKVAYLFGPLLFMFLGVAYAISMIRRYKPDDDAAFMRIVFITGYILLAGLGVTLNCTHALRQVTIDHGKSLQ